MSATIDESPKKQGKDMSIGRNDLCICGSGKKYKKCCITSNVAILDVAWKNLRQTESNVVDRHLSPYLLQELPPEIFRTAFEDFFPETLPEEIDVEMFLTQFGIPWILFNWLAEEPFEGASFETTQTIAMNYYHAHQNKLNPSDKQFIQEMNKTYYSFYSIVDVVPEKSLSIKDILLGTTHTVKEKQGTHYLKKGDIIFARLLDLEGRAIFIGMAPISIPAIVQMNLLDFRGELIAENDNNALTGVLLREVFDWDILDYFFETLEYLYHPPKPMLVNTDGDFLIFSKTHFKLEMSIEETLKRLLPLTFLKKPDEILESAEKSKSGEIKRLEFPWLMKGNKKHKDWENTILGSITLEKGRLILETNSEKRTEKGKKLLNKCLGNNIQFQQTLLEMPEQALHSKPEVRTPEPLMPPEMLEEVQENMKIMAQNHWEEWFDEAIPALLHQTPREAGKD